MQTTLRNRILALQKYGVKSEVAFFARGDGEYIFKDIPHCFIGSAEHFKRKINEGNYNYLSFIYSLEYLPHVPDRFAGKIIYEVRGWNERIAQYISNLNKYGRLDGIICIAEYLKPMVRRLARNIPVFVDGNTVHPMFHYRKPSDRSWKECPVPQKDHKVIAYVGRIERSKNWREFVRICAKLSKTEKIEPWIICNRDTTREYPRLLRKSSRKGLGHVLKVISHVPNHYMPEVYSVIKDTGGCILSTSTREGLGNHILEPMACTLPIVSSNVPGKNEIITHRHNGLLYQLGDIDRSVRYVKEVITDQRLRDTLQKNGLRKIRKVFNEEKYANRYLKILSELL
ncbi:glycosyltransferase [Paenibacillus lautus]|uniref:glycosyltransferase n=1 Tax=Paenibacillus lautus TaxID=1401 RepID=UPI001C108986|nr:glycosyltransferase [Paenibacillus lautus]MBU5350622.1 glycosyltransferase [Paenibacillus lautus]